MVLAYAVELVESITELREVAGRYIACEVIFYPLAVEALFRDVGIGKDREARDSFNLGGEFLWGHAYCIAY